MSREPVTPVEFGRRVLGPIVAEFCLQLWSLGSLMERRGDAALLFCARGGLRMQLAYERFLAASDLPSPLPVAPLMVSRVVAIGPTLVRTADEGLDALLPSAASTLGYEFPRASLAGVALAMSGVAPAGADPAWDAPFTSPGLAALLRHADGEPVAAALRQQARLFTRHLEAALGGRRHAVLVDTGLYGTTRQVLAEGLPDIQFSSALIARSYRPGPTTAGRSRTFGLSVQAESYSPLRRRTAMLRYWHFVEWLFEPDLVSVRTFTDHDGVPRSNLEVEGWQDRVLPDAGSAFAGIVDYIDALPAGPAEQVLRDSDRAWSEFRRAVVWPDLAHVPALSVGTRSHGFGSDATWSSRPWRGPMAALRGASMWREGEIAGSGTPLRRPLLAAIETAYGVRRLKRAVTRSH